MEPNANFSTQNSFTVIQPGFNCLIKNISPVLKNDPLFTLDTDPHTHAHSSHTHIMESLVTENEEKVCYRNNCFPRASHMP